jgi:hypothetical protein
MRSMSMDVKSGDVDDERGKESHQVSNPLHLI